MRSRHATLVGACLLASACGIDVPRTDRPTTSSGSSASDVHDPSVASPRLSFDPALRRMSDTEYRRSVSDLLGVPVPSTVQLPPDAETRGFTNQADALDVSGLLFEGYESAAESVVDVLLRRPQIHVIVDAPVTEVANSLSVPDEDDVPVWLDLNSRPAPVIAVEDDATETRMPETTRKTTTLVRAA